MPLAKTEKVFKRDRLMIAFMKEHRGKENVASSVEISKFLSFNGFSIKNKNVGQVMSNLMYDYNAPICYLNGKGYYWAARAEEIRDTITDLEGRISAMKTHIEHLRHFIIE